MFNLVLLIDIFKSSYDNVLRDECHGILLMISQHWLRKWLGAIRQQAITWTSVDHGLQRHMASLGPNELSVHVLTDESMPSQVNKHIDQNYLSMISYEVIISYLNADLFSICHTGNSFTNWKKVSIYLMI